MRDVDIVVPTLRRPAQLERALRSVFAQTAGPERIASIVVVDNAPEGSARDVVDRLREEEAGASLVYVHEPHPGVATARNAGVAAGRAALVAFLDDDEEAFPDWLERLCAAHLQLGAAVTFGPIQGVAAPDARLEHRAYLDSFFSRRRDGEASGLIPIYYGCGNSVVTRAIALADPRPFDPAADQCGGEDDRLFLGLAAKGHGFGWAADAWVYEHAAPDRSRVPYALRRAFAYGQGPSQASFHEGDWIGLVRNMAIGCGQASVYGLASLLLLAGGRRASALRFLDLALRGAGKVAWTWRLDFYGAAALA